MPTQGVSGNKAVMARILNVPPEKVRILTANVGGSFGMKNLNYPEYACILHAAKALGRPVKWTDERSTSFLSDSQGRAQMIHAELALDAEGKFLAVRLSGYGNLGAFITGVAPGPLSLNTGKNLASVYRTPLLGVDIKTVLTNTTHMGAYRGAGRPEANYYMERLIDRAADEMGIDRLTLRKRNFIKPAQLPFAAASGVTYDSGDFAGVLAKALEISDHGNFAKRKRESRKNGKLRGIAVGSYLEVTAPPSGELGKITFDPDGSVTLTTGTLDYGQGHATPFAQVLTGAARRALRQDQAAAERQRSRALRQRHRRLALDHRDRTGDRRSFRAGGREGQEGGGAFPGSLRSRHRIFRRALHHRRHRPLDRHHGAGRAACARARCPRACPTRSTSITPPRRRVSTFPNGCHVAEVEIDPDTGVVQDRALRRGQRFRHRRQSDDRRGPAPWRRRAGHRPGADGRGELRRERPADHRLVHGLCACRARKTFRRWTSAIIPRRPSPIRWAPRAAAKPAAPAASSASSMPWSMRWANTASSDINMPLTPEKIWRAIQDAKAKAA